MLKEEHSTKGEKESENEKKIKDEDMVLKIDETHFCEIILTIISYILVLVTFPFSLFVSIKIVKEYERAVIFRLGRLLDGGTRGPGVIFVLPCIDSYRKVDLRTVSYEAPTQQVYSRDAVPMSMNSVVFYRVSNPVAAVCNVSDFSHSTQLMATAAIRSEMGTRNLKDFAQKDFKCEKFQKNLCESAKAFGVEVEKI